MKWLERAEHELMVDEEKLIARLRTHYSILGFAIILGLVSYILGINSAIMMSYPWLLSGCQEYIDYYRRY